MSRTVALIYGTVVYVFFFATFCYSIGFVENLVVPKGIDDGIPGPTQTAVLIDIVLLGLFGLQHSLMARPAFKNVWCRIVPQVVERSTYVLFATSILAILMWQWRALPTPVWSVQAPALRILLYAISLGGWLLVLYSTFVIDHFDLFGLRQVWLYYRDVEHRHPPFMARAVYRWIRHPIMAGFIIAFWAAPTMSQGRLLFAAVSTVYILVAIQLEERDLVNLLGDAYLGYRRQTRMLIPLPRGRGEA